MVASFALLMCSRRPAHDRPLRIAIHSEPHSLDPHLQNETLTFGFLRNIFEGLTGFNGDMVLVPTLAESWDNPSDTVWRFHLRRDVRFHDGRPLTAQDVVFSLERARHPRASTNFGSYLVAVDTLRTIDPHTIEITTRQPYPILLNKLTFVLIVPDGSPDTIVEPIGTGPYRLTPRVPGQPLRLEAFKDYWGHSPAETPVDFAAVPDHAARLRQLASGEIDIAQDPTPAEAAELLRAQSKVRVLERDSLLVVYLQMHPGKPPFDDRRVREAVRLALDRQPIVERSLGGRGLVLAQMVGRNTFGYDESIRAPARDLPRARALLGEVGYPQGIDVELEFRAGREATEIQRQLGEAGIRVRLVERSWAEMFPRLLTRQVPFYLGALLDPSADASDFFDAVAHTRQAATGYGDNNTCDYSNPALDILIESSGTTLDMRTRREMLSRAMRTALDDAIFVPLYSPSVLFAVRDYVVWKPRLDSLVLAADIQRR
ncbi:MAG: ABC transporter substrate-binding protein [Acidobacteriota bacterium]